LSDLRFNEYAWLMPPKFANLIKTGLQLYTTLSFICPRDGKKKGVYQWKRGDQTAILPVLLLVDAMLTLRSVEATGRRFGSTKFGKEA